MPPLWQEFKYRFKVCYPREYIYPKPEKDSDKGCKKQGNIYMNAKSNSKIENENCRIV